MTFYRYIRLRSGEDSFVPNLVNPDGTFVSSTTDKANLLAREFQKVYSSSAVGPLGATPPMEILSLVFLR